MSDKTVLKKDEPSKGAKTVEDIKAETDLVRSEMELEVAKGERDKPKALEALSNELTEREKNVTAREEAANQRELGLEAREDELTKSSLILEQARTMKEGIDEQVKEILSKARAQAQGILQKSLSTFGEASIDIVRIANIVHGCGNNIISLEMKHSLLTEIRTLTTRLGISMTYDAEGNLEFWKGDHRLR